MTSSESDPLPVGLLCSSFQLPSSAAVCWEYPLPGTAPVLLLSGPSLLTSSFCTHCGAPGSDSAHFPGLGWPRCAPVPRTLTVHPTSLCPAPLGKQSGQASRAPFGAPWRLHLEFRSLCAKPSVLEVCPSSHAWGCEWGGCKSTSSSERNSCGLLAKPTLDCRKSAGPMAVLALGGPLPT